eukprot:g239.t1
MNSSRSCHFVSYRDAPGGGFIVDGFKLPRNGCTIFFLTHFHGDHYGGLSEKFNELPPECIIYCSSITASLVTSMLGVDACRVRLLTVGKTVEVIEGAFVSAVDANHCPGALLLVFETSSGNIIHTGDMRFARTMLEDPALIRVQGKVDQLFLDTTYWNPKFSIPDQAETISQVVSASRDWFNQYGDKALVLIESYNIGKEKILLALAQELDMKIYAPPKKLERLLPCVIEPKLLPYFTSDPNAPIHVVKMGSVGNVWPYFLPNFGGMTRYLAKTNSANQRKNVLGIIPTGWANSSKWNRKNSIKNNSENTCRVQLVAYSEHSSADELLEFVKFLKPTEIIPHVYSDENERKKILSLYQNCTNRTVSKRKFFQRFGVENSTKKQRISVVKEEEMVKLETNDGKIEGKEKQREKKVVKISSKSSKPSKTKKVRSSSVSTRDISSFFKKPTGQWSCSVCTLLNCLSLKKCLVCGTSRGKRETKKTQSFVDLSKKSPKKFISVSPLKKRSLPKLESPLPSTKTCADMISVSPKMESPSNTLTKTSSLYDSAESALSIDPFSFSPCDVINASWCSGWKKVKKEADSKVNAPYLLLCEAFELLSNTTKRTLKKTILTNVFHLLMSCCPENDITAALFLTTNKILPEWEGDKAELSMGGSAINKLIRDVCGVNRATISKLWKKYGDSGDVAIHARGEKKKQTLLIQTKPILIYNFWETLKNVCNLQGQGSTKQRHMMILNILRSCRGCELRWVIRTLARHLRTGATRITILQCLGSAYTIFRSKTERNEKRSKTMMEKNIKEAEDVLRIAYNCQGDFRVLISALLSVENGIENVRKNCVMKPGLPVKPMLANVATSVDDLIVKMEKAEETLQKKSKKLEKVESFSSCKFICEMKYDGQRAQVHLLDDGTIKCFSRNSEDMTTRFPSILEIAKSTALKDVNSFVLDAEVIAVAERTLENNVTVNSNVVKGTSAGEANGVKILPFQQLSTRPRKNDPKVIVKKQTTAVCLIIFDILSLNGNSLLDVPLRERREILQSSIREIKGKWEFARSVITDDPVEIKKFLNVSLQSKCEGVMAKLLSSSYEPSKRVNGWLKLKKDYIDGMADSIDVVPIAAWHGKGRKAGWFSPFLVAVYDRETESYESVCRVMSGFSDEFYKEWTTFFQDGKILPQKDVAYNTDESPPVWFSPEVVWEIRGAEFQISPVHKAASGILLKDGKGLGLRFPRFLRVKEDRDVTTATSPEDIIRLWKQ